MQFSWLNQKNNKKLILFLNGWGMDENAIKHLDCNDFDVLTLYDYRDFNFSFNKFDFKKYKEKYLVCWSMGVYTANLFYDFLNTFDKKIALAGTGKIIDNQFGIPEKIYNYTIKFFNDESKQKFIKNMFRDDSEIEIKRTTLELKEELISIQNIKTDSIIEFDKAIIPNDDIVVPYKNQINYWQKTNAEIIEINSAHYAFNNYKSWQEIIC